MFPIKYFSGHHHYHKNCSHPIFRLYPPSCFLPPSYASNLGSASGNELSPLTDHKMAKIIVAFFPTLLSPTRMMGSDELKTTVLGIAFEADTTNCLCSVICTNNDWACRLHKDRVVLWSFWSRNWNERKWKVTFKEGCTFTCKSESYPQLLLGYWCPLNI